MSSSHNRALYKCPFTLCTYLLYSTAEELREKIPAVAKDLEKSQNDLANIVTEENRAANEVQCDFCFDLFFSFSFSFPVIFLLLLSF